MTYKEEAEIKQKTEHEAYTQSLKDKGYEVEAYEADDDSWKKGVAPATIKKIEHDNAIFKEAAHRKATKKTARKEALHKYYEEETVPVRQNIRRLKYEKANIISLGGIGPLTAEEKAIIKRYKNTQSVARYRNKLRLKKYNEETPK